MSKSKNFMVYGANGYTGELIVRYAVAMGMKPVLAGRNVLAIKTMAEKYQLPYEICNLYDKEELNDAVLGVNVVLNCAGPFINTYKPMMKACLKNGTHYIDITGEMEVFERLQRTDAVCKEAGIMALPGAGFDVVPTDCLAAFLKKNLPTATHLQLGFMGIGGGLSHGTATTALQNLGNGGAVRMDGKIKKVPAAYKTKQLPFRKGKNNLAVTIPWGDVSTAFYSTGIPNIEVYMAVTSGAVRMLQLSDSMGWLIGSNTVKNFLQARVDNRKAGPSDKERKKGKSFIWGKVMDGAGNEIEARLSTPEGYTLTALTALNAVKKVLAGNAPVGFKTPSMAYGADFIMEIPGVVRENMSMKREINIE